MAENKTIWELAGFVFTVVFDGSLSDEIVQDSNHRIISRLAPSGITL